MNRCLILACALSIAIVIGSAAGEKKKPAVDSKWQLVLEEDFSDESYKKDWLVEGTADLSVVAEDGKSYLKIQTTVDKDIKNNKQSNFWCKKRFEGDLRFVWRAKGEAGNKSIFYFNANVTKSSKYKTIFDWKRPDAQMARYAADDNIELYTLCILRDAPRANKVPPIEEFGYLGGSTAQLFAAALKPENDVPPYSAYKKFHRETVIHEFPNVFAAKPDTWFDFELTIVGKKITLHVDGKKIFKLEDTGGTADEGYTWTPLTKGGHIAFRNFASKAVTLDYVKVYQKKTKICACDCTKKKKTTTYE